ncbi:kinase-like domain-containing protein [Phyllosticta capitalensis]|uniref:kinase-like domain-containing protein n=1 Tax=Phyllosticta capitalensis TaxID=121624 RepID=UPI00312E8917
MSQNEADTPLDVDLQFILDTYDFLTVPDSLENDAAEQRPSDGRSLFQFAVYKAAEAWRLEYEPGYRFTAAERRDLIAVVNSCQEVSQKWRELGRARRAWISKAHEWFPVPWEGLKRKVPPFDVFCNDDEVHYSWQRNPEMKEDEIRKRYRDGHWLEIEGLKEPFTKAEFTKEARRINHAKGYRYAIRNWRPYFFRENNPPYLEQKDYVTDTRYMDKVFRNPRPEGCYWACGATLGEGGFGTALRYDLIENNTVRQKIVVKRDKVHTFSNDYERKVGAMLKDKSPYIVNYLTPGSRAAQGKPGVGYLEYAEGGDLHGIISKYRVQKWVMPEPFCWYLLHCLAEACCVLEKGRPPRLDKGGSVAVDDDDNNWTPMFHFDLKPGNILLNSPAKNPAYWWQRNYPVPMMADLGGLARYPNDRNAKPDAYGIVSDQPKYQYPRRHYLRGISGCGTPGYDPFELKTLDDQAMVNRMRPEDPLPWNQKIRIHTTVYQVGVVVHQAMTKSGNPANGEDNDDSRHRPRKETLPFRRGTTRKSYEEEESTDDDSDGEALQKKLNAKPYSPQGALLPHYSHKLVDLVWKCMAPRAFDRPTPTELWKETSQMMAEIDRMWPDPATNSAEADGDSDDNTNWDELDYRSFDEDTDDGDDPDHDPRAASDYELIREQFADVDPKRVPKLYRAAHAAKWLLDPTTRKFLRGQQRTIRRNQRRSKRREDFFADYEHDIKLYNQRNFYIDAREAEEGRYLREKRRNDAAWWRRWDKMTDAEQDEAIAPHVETWRKTTRWYTDDFGEDAMKNFVRWDKPKRPVYVEEESSGSDEDDDAIDKTDDKETQHEAITPASGKLLHHGPRMLAMPWDGRPVGSRVMRPENYKRWKVDHGHVTSDEESDDELLMDLDINDGDDYDAGNGGNGGGIGNRNRSSGNGGGNNGGRVPVITISSGTGGGDGNGGGRVPVITISSGAGGGGGNGGGRVPVITISD